MGSTVKKFQFNVLEYNWNRRENVAYDVMPYFRNNWKSKNFNFDKDKVKDRKTLKEWIERCSRYMFWARCEYEFLMAPWPYRDDTLKDDMKKIDVHEQIMMNIDVITELLFNEFKLNKKTAIKNDGSKN